MVPHKKINSNTWFHRKQLVQFCSFDIIECSTLSTCDTTTLYSYQLFSCDYENNTIVFKINIFTKLFRIEVRFILFLLILTYTLLRDTFRRLFVCSTYGKGTHFYLGAVSQFLRTFTPHFQNEKQFIQKPRKDSPYLFKIS